MSERLDKLASKSLSDALERVRTRLHEAELNAPPQVYQALEALREKLQSRLEETETQLSQLAHEIGETEDDLLEWLKLDIRSLERRLLGSLINASDKSRAELKQWLKTSEE